MISQSRLFRLNAVRTNEMAILPLGRKLAFNASGYGHWFGYAAQEEQRTLRFMASQMCSIYGRIEVQGRQLNFTRTDDQRPGTGPLTPIRATFGGTKLGFPSCRPSNNALHLQQDIVSFCGNLFKSFTRPSHQEHNAATSPLKEPSAILGALWPEKRPEQGSINVMRCQNPGNQ